MKIKCILFDLDGTLLNTNDLVLESLKHTIRTHMETEVDERKLYKYFGQPLVKIMADLDPSRADVMVATYREHNVLIHDQMTKVFPQVPETLAALKAKGIPMAIVTSKLKGLAYRGLGLFGLEEMFDTCIAFEDTEKHKPEPAPVLKALTAIGTKFEGSNVVMVGDSPYDIMCAHNAGVKAAVVEWSLHPREVLAPCKPDIWLTKFSDLLGYV